MKSRKLKHYWYLWPLFALLWCFTRLPYRWLMFNGRCLGQLLRCLPTRMRAITRINIQQCFPELTPAQQQQLLARNFSAAGMGIIEILISWFGPVTRLQTRFHVHQLENVTRYTAQGRAVILLCPHLTALEICGTLLAKHLPFAVIYNKLKLPLAEVLNHTHLNKHYVTAIPRENLRQALKCLHQAIPVFYTPDIDPVYHGGVFAPFFGVSAYSLTATAKIAAATHAVVVPVAFFRRNDYSGYDLTFENPIEHYPSGDVEQDATTINAVMEKIIRCHPEQYMWQYKRFKTRPPGSVDFYDRTLHKISH